MVDSVGGKMQVMKLKKDLEPPKPYKGKEPVTIKGTGSFYSSSSVGWQNLLSKLPVVGIQLQDEEYNSSQQGCQRDKQ